MMRITSVSAPSASPLRASLPPCSHCVLSLVHWMVCAAQSVSKKVRSAQQSAYNFILVVGDSESRDGTVTVRLRDNDVRSLSLALSSQCCAPPLLGSIVA